MRRKSGSSGDRVTHRDEAYTRGRAMLAAARIRRAAQESGASALGLDDINALIRATRKARSRGGQRRYGVRIVLDANVVSGLLHDTSIPAQVLDNCIAGR